MPTTEETSPEIYAPGGFSVTLSRRMCGAVLVVTVSGSVDQLNAPTLDDRLQGLLELGNLRRLVIDLSRVDSFSAAGPRCLVRAGESGKERGIQVRVVSGDDVVRRAIDACDHLDLPPAISAVDDACHFESSEGATTGRERRYAGHENFPQRWRGRRWTLRAAAGCTEETGYREDRCS